MNRQAIPTGERRNKRYDALSLVHMVYHADLGPFTR